MEYQLHPDLQRDGISLGNFPLCQLLLIDDSRYPWFVLVPRRGGISEAFELSEADYQQLGRESREFGRMIKALLGGEKLNVAALGNITPQLHIHHIVRFRGDEAWPAPIWGRGLAQPYDEGGLRQLLENLREPLFRIPCDFVWEDSVWKDSVWEDWLKTNSRGGRGQCQAPPERGQRPGEGGK